MPRFHEVIENKYTWKIGYICRVINFIEDIIEDAECSDILLNSDILDTNTLLIDPRGCLLDIAESINVFKDLYDLGNVKRGFAARTIPYRSLYDIVIKLYHDTIHQEFKRYAVYTDNTRVEFFLGILFNGKGFIAEGEEDRVSIPGFPMCISAHTHPGGVLSPSKRDLTMIIKTLTDRGIGHIVTTSRQSIAIYRTKPLSIHEYIALREISSKESPVDVLNRSAALGIIKVLYI